MVRRQVTYVNYLLRAKVLLRINSDGAILLSCVDIATQLVAQLTEALHVWTCILVNVCLGEFCTMMSLRAFGVDLI